MEPSIHRGGARLVESKVTINNYGTTLGVNIENYNGEALVLITDKTGMLVSYDNTTVEKDTEVEQDIEAVEPGKYTVSVITEEGVTSKTFTKEQ